MGKLISVEAQDSLTGLSSPGGHLYKNPELPSWVLCVSREGVLSMIRASDMVWILFGQKDPSSLDLIDLGSGSIDTCPQYTGGRRSSSGLEYWFETLRVRGTRWFDGCLPSEVMIRNEGISSSRLRGIPLQFYWTIGSTNRSLVGRI